MTVGRMRAEMSNHEFIHWAVYFGRKAQRQELAMKSARRTAPAAGRGGVGAS